MSDSPPATSPTGDLRGRVALVTGVGRKRAIASSVCRTLASRGADIVFSYWSAYERETPWTSDEGESGSLLRETHSFISPGSFTSSMISFRE